jgi:hypothetical protein
MHSHVRVFRPDSVEQCQANGCCHLKRDAKSHERVIGHPTSITIVLESSSHESNSTLREMRDAFTYERQVERGAALRTPRIFDDCQFVPLSGV